MEMCVHVIILQDVCQISNPATGLQGLSFLSSVYKYLYIVLPSELTYSLISLPVCQVPTAPCILVDEVHRSCSACVSVSYMV